MKSSLTNPSDETPTLPISNPDFALLDAPRSTPGAPSGSAALPCPRCGQKLIDPDSLGWCPKCGYCRSLEEAAVKAPALAPVGTAHKPSQLGVVEFYQLVANLPGWFWVVVVMAGLVLVASLAADFFLPDNSLARAIWCSVQFFLGLVLIFAAQVWAMMLVVADDDKLGPKDLFVSFRLWRVTLAQLPATRKPVWLGTWGLSAMLCAVFVVGGYSYWYRFYQPKKRANNTLRDIAAMAQAAGTNDRSLEDSVKDFADSQDLTKKKNDEKDKDKDKPKVDRRPTEQCVIIGYTLDPETKNLSGLVLARSVGGRLRYGGVVRRGWTPEASKQLLNRLARLKRAEPLIRSLNLPDAVWVNPALFCEIHQSGYDDEGRLRDPNFKELLD